MIFSRRQGQFTSNYFSQQALQGASRRYVVTGQAGMKHRADEANDAYQHYLRDRTYHYPTHLYGEIRGNLLTCEVHSLPSFLLMLLLFFFSVLIVFIISLEIFELLSIFRSFSR
jgi:hypothetical protein